jgi:pimeloyl-ACP methyl ester carboxylesterase
MAIALNGSALPVALGNGYSLRVPGFRGTAEVTRPGAAGTRALRSLGSGMAALDAALAAENVSEVRQIELDLRPSAGPVPVVPLRSTRGDREPVVELQVPDLGPDVRQVVLSIDDAGVARWHIAEIGADITTDAPSTRGAGATIRFLIPIASASLVADTDPQRRSILGAVARRILKVLVYPLTDPVFGALGDHYARRWEETKRPYRLRPFAPGNHQRPDVTPLAAAELSAMQAAGPVLMFIHGTFSTSHGGFGDLPVATLEALHERYGGRVVAFDHPTLADAPDDNVRWLLSNLPQSPMKMDIVCHSRGGLVSRVLAERSAAFDLDGSRIDVRRIVFGGVPNGGTVLADPDHMVDMIDRFTTLLTLAPTGPVTETFEALVTVVKIIGHGALKGLRGLASMHPDGTLLAALNRPGGREVEYFAMASDYEPTDRGLQTLVADVADSAIDRIFGNTGNDLVVPTDGVWSGNGGGGFPVPAERVLSFTPAEGVMHTQFFGQEATSRKLLDWLA